MIGVVLTLANLGVDWKSIVNTKLTPEQFYTHIPQIDHAFYNDHNFEVGTEYTMLISNQTANLTDCIGLQRLRTERCLGFFITGWSCDKGRKRRQEHVENVSGNAQNLGPRFWGLLHVNWRHYPCYRSLEVNLFRTENSKWLYSKFRKKEMLQIKINRSIVDVFLV